MDFMAHARSEDLQEVLVGSGRNFADCPLSELVAAGNLCLVDTEEDCVHAIGGLNGDIIWMLCTDKVEQHPIKFLRFTKACLKELLEDKKVLYNTVWKGNQLHVKWLKWMGAEFIKEINNTHILFIFRKEETDV